MYLNLRLLLEQLIFLLIILSVSFYTILCILLELVLAFYTYSLYLFYCCTCRLHNLPNTSNQFLQNFHRVLTSNRNIVYNAELQLRTNFIDNWFNRFGINAITINTDRQRHQQSFYNPRFSRNQVASPSRHRRRGNPRLSNEQLRAFQRNLLLLEGEQDSDYSPSTTPSTEERRNFN